MRSRHTIHYFAHRHLFSSWRQRGAWDGTWHDAATTGGTLASFCSESKRMLACACRYANAVAFRVAASSTLLQLRTCYAGITRQRATWRRRARKKAQRCDRSSSVKSAGSKIMRQNTTRRNADVTAESGTAAANACCNVQHMAAASRAPT